jgi:hypothetical protein
MTARETEADEEAELSRTRLRSELRPGRRERFREAFDR